MNNKLKFEDWMDTFTDSICTYDYYVDFEKVYKNVEKYKIELNILNSLIGSSNIENEFYEILKKYPEVLNCIPLLLAIRIKNKKKEIFATDFNDGIKYRFDDMVQSPEEYFYFMKKTGLVDLIKDKKIKDLYDYATGVEVGLDSNARKNRGGHLMEDLVESYIKNIENVEYFKELNSTVFKKMFNIDLSTITDSGKNIKRFDYVIKTKNTIYGIETNFYNSSGSKLNETARSYKYIAEKSKEIEGFEFIWITDGKGWKAAKNNLHETYDSMDYIFNINDLKAGALNNLK